MKKSYLLNFDREVYASLLELSKVLDTSVADLIRRAIDALLQHYRNSLDDRKNIS